jgi:predicted nucleotidyltransferase
MTRYEILQRLRREKNDLEERYRLRIAGVFGSYARGEEGADSDIDILVEPRGATLFDLGGLLTDLEEMLGCRVDVVSTRGLRKEIEPYVLRDLVTI